MNDPTVIQRLLFLLSFLASASFYLCRVRAARFRIGTMIEPWFPPPEPDLPHRKTLFLAALHSGDGDKNAAVGGGQKVAGRKASAKNRLSVAGDWLAPAIVWLLIIMMGMAVVGFLVGER